MTTRESILSRLTKGVSGTDQELFSKDGLSKFADFYRDKWDENTSEDVIASTYKVTGSRKAVSDLWKTLQET